MDSELDKMKAHLRYVGITDADIIALRGLRTIVAANADRFVDRFYQHLKAFEGTRRFLTDPAVVRRLLDAQRAYLLSFFDAAFDDAYYRHRRTIGHTHFRIGLNFQWYIGAYNLYLEFLMPLILTSPGTPPSSVPAAQSAIIKATLLDMSIVLEAYHEGDKAALEASRAQVIHQEKLAAVGLLASGLAHEIGNPLASIQAVCDNQIRKSPPPEFADKFQRIRDQVARVTKIVRQLVGFARPAPPAWLPVNYNEIIESALAIARLARSARTVDTRMELEPSLPSGLGVADQLGQVFLNLLLNAWDALPENGGEVVIRSACVDGKVEVSVRDSGTGIAPDAMKHLFTPFFTTKDVGKGTGLGLHVCEGIVNQHGGRILVESTPGSGSTFRVVLPILTRPPDGGQTA